MEDPGNHDSVRSRSCGSCSSSHSQQGSLQQTRGWKTAARQHDIITKSQTRTEVAEFSDRIKAQSLPKAAPIHIHLMK